MDDCPKGLNTQTHKRLGSFTKEQVANGNFIKHKSGIYTVGQKDTSPPSGTGKEKNQAATPKVGEQLIRERGSQVAMLEVREQLTQEPCLWQEPCLQVELP